ncbi:MAG: diguanylate cyclase [Myxococcota bacterium]|nr:diguanylate cyclase [Myxococcota bacterium]
MSLRAKLVAYIIGAVAVIQLSWGLSVVRSDAALLEMEAERRSRAILHAVAAPAAIHMATREFANLDAILDVYAKKSTGDLAFQSIAVIDSGGLVVAHTDPREYGRRLTGPFVDRAMKTQRSISQAVETKRGRVVRFSMPVTSGLRWGTIIAETSMYGLDDRVVQNQLVVLFSTVLIAVSTAILIWAMLNRMVFGPLEGFAVVSKRLAGGRYDARVTVPDTKDELAVLGTTLNDMASHIQSHAGRLEAQVDKRTREFQEANEALGRANRDLANAVEELARLARTDGLTQLNNHRTFHERIKAEVKRSERSHSPLTLLMIDVDHFKQYNDTHGHPAGDKVLLTVAQMMQETLRATDVIARYGGEEFAVLLVDTPLSFGARVADKLRTAIRQTTFPGAEVSQPTGKLTISVGMAGWPMHGKTDVALIEAADKALYQAKRAGRDQVTLYGGDA